MTLGFCVLFATIRVFVAVALALNKETSIYGLIVRVNDLRVMTLQLEKNNWGKQGSQFDHLSQFGHI